MGKKQLYGYSVKSNGGGGAAANLSSGGGSKYIPRSVSKSKVSSDNSLLSSSRYLASSDPLSSSSSSSMLFGHTVQGVVSSPTTTHLASQVSWSGPPGVDVGPVAAASDLLHAALKRPASGALYHQNIMSSYNTIGQTEAWYSTNPLTKRPRFENASNLPIYPQRPGEKDCAHYMLTRTCKFGDSCKFDHPIWVPEGGIPDWKEVPVTFDNDDLPERPMEPDCPYFLKTQRCKFGGRCKFNHPKDKMPHPGYQGTSESSDGATLPERPSEPPCAFYLKTGKCKYGATCKFHHPKGLQIPISGIDYHGAEDANLGSNELFGSPAMMHNTKGLPIRPGELDCPFYLKTGSCKYGPTCRYNHPDRNAINPPAAIIGSAFEASPSKHLNIGVLDPASSILQSFDPRLTQTTLQLGLAMAMFPQRPGEIECDFYMKTGVCKYGQRCRYHHPIALPDDSQMENVRLTLAGLPRREGAIHCPYYMKTGTCKYGATCKFDHPPPGEAMSIAVGPDGGGSEKENEDR